MSRFVITMFLVSFVTACGESEFISENVRRAGGGSLDKNEGSSEEGQSGNLAEDGTNPETADRGVLDDPGTDAAPNSEKEPSSEKKADKNVNNEEDKSADNPSQKTDSTTCSLSHENAKVYNLRGNKAVLTQVEPGPLIVDTRGSLSQITLDLPADQKNGICIIARGTSHVINITSASKEMGAISIDLRGDSSKVIFKVPDGSTFESINYDLRGNGSTFTLESPSGMDCQGLPISGNISGNSGSVTCKGP